MSQKQYAASLKNFLEALKMNHDSSLDITKLLYDNIGVAYEDKGENKKALEYIDKLYNLSFKTGDSVNICIALETKGGIFTRLKRFDTAEICLKSAIEMAKEVKMNAITETAYHDIGDLYDEWGKPKLALDWIIKYHNLKDSIFN